MPDEAALSATQPDAAHSVRNYVEPLIKLVVADTGLNQCPGISQRAPDAPERDIRMAEKTVLTRDELAYINRLVNQDVPDTSAPRSGFRIDGGPQSNELLGRLASHAELSLQAKFGDFSMSFPLLLKEDEFHNLELQLAPPRIFENGTVTRAWRLHLDKPLPLLTDDGSESSLNVHELSSNGLLVTAGKQRKPPKHFNLLLALPNEAPLAVDASRVREVKGGAAAYEVEFAREQDAERIRSFLYQQHQKLHPELQPELPVDLV